MKKIKRIISWIISLLSYNDQMGILNSFYAQIGSLFAFFEKKKKKKKNSCFWKKLHALRSTLKAHLWFEGKSLNIWLIQNILILKMPFMGTNISMSVKNSWPNLNYQRFVQDYFFTKARTNISFTRKCFVHIHTLC